MQVKVNLNDPTDVQRSAVLRIKQSIDFEMLLPQSVFMGTWHAFRFFESECIFDPQFADVIRQFIEVESGHLACLVNADKSGELKGDLIDAAFISTVTSLSDFESLLRSGGPQSGWLFNVDRYACSSDTGNWCIYCEKSNDIAVVGLRTPADAVRFGQALRALEAEPIEELLQSNRDRFPFNRLVSEWRAGLIRNYGNR